MCVGTPKTTPMNFAVAPEPARITGEACRSTWLKEACWLHSGCRVYDAIDSLHLEHTNSPFQGEWVSEEFPCAVEHPGRAADRCCNQTSRPEYPFTTCQRRYTLKSSAALPFQRSPSLSFEITASLGKVHSAFSLT